MKKDRPNLHEAVTAQIIAQIEANPGTPVLPWQRPAGRALHIPKNATTDNAYRGINVIMPTDRNRGDE